jgi:GT2 family glycosyltransferase
MSKNFSVVICTYNRKYFIKNCLEKILQNTVIPKKIIIVDQNYDNVTLNYAIHTLKKYFYKNYIIIKNIKKIGLTTSKNIALKYTKEKYIFFIDDDISLNKFFFINILKSMKISRATGISGVISNQKKSPLNIVIHFFFNYGPFLDNRYYFNYYKKFKNKIILKRVQQVPGGITCFPNSIFKHIKFDEKLITHNYEDVDFCIRLKKKFNNPKFYLNFKAEANDELQKIQKHNLKKRISAMYLLSKKHSSAYFYLVFILSFLLVFLSNFRDIVKLVYDLKIKNRSTYLN